MATDLNLFECASNFATKGHYEYPERLQCLIGTLTHPTLGKLATVRCLQIQRRIWFKEGGDFLEMMDAVSQELNQFSVDLFDENSNVHPWLVDSGAKSGSGCWSTELSIGDMLYIEDLEVKQEVCSLVSFIFFFGSRHFGFLVQGTRCWLVAPPGTLDLALYWIQGSRFLLADAKQVYCRQG